MIAGRLGFVAMKGPTKDQMMFFLLRCAFFLGLVFLHMDWKGAESLLPTTESVAREATSQCLANAKLCMEVASEAQKLANLVEAKPAPAAAPAPHRGPAKP